LRERQSVIGFTEAELGLVLAVVGLSLWASITPRTPGTVEIRSEELDSLRRAAAEAVHARGTLDSLREVVDKMPGRSNQTPTCVEKGFATRVIADIRIVDANEFVVEEARLSMDELLDRLAGPLAYARENECRHSVRVHVESNVSPESFTAAFKAIRVRFNTELQ
jgi:hypothetical protein